jgi:hypothetical protein
VTNDIGIKNPFTAAIMVFSFSMSGKDKAYYTVLGAETNTIISSF